MKEHLFALHLVSEKIASTSTWCFPSLYHSLPLGGFLCAPAWDTLRMDSCSDLLPALLFPFVPCCLKQVLDSAIANLGTYCRVIAHLKRCSCFAKCYFWCLVDTLSFGAIYIRKALVAYREEVCMEGHSAASNQQLCGIRWMYCWNWMRCVEQWPNCVADVFI